MGRQAACVYAWAVSDSPLAPHASSPAELQERIEAERAGTPFLVYRDHEGHQHLLELRGGQERVTIGRRPVNDVALVWDGDVSRLHAELERIAGDWTIADDGLSQNGTWVNGERVTGKRRLRDGDAILAGRTTVVFCAPYERESVVTGVLTGDKRPVELSSAQRRVLLALCRPFRDSSTFATPASNQQIADELVVSVETVKSHLSALYELFGVAHLPQNQKRAQLAWEAFKSGVISARELWEQPAC
jgi:pSer/pThr/pTyr-binding forkhead associated (FHA) protein